MKFISWFQSVTKIALSNIAMWAQSTAYFLCQEPFKNTAIAYTEVPFSSCVQRNTAEKIHSKVYLYVFQKEPAKAWQQHSLKIPHYCWRISFELPAAGLKGLSMKLLCNHRTIHTQSILHATVVFCDPVRNNSITGPVILMWSDSNTEFTEFYWSSHWFWQQCHKCSCKRDVVPREILFQVVPWILKLSYILTL